MGCARLGSFGVRGGTRRSLLGALRAREKSGDLEWIAESTSLLSIARARRFSNQVRVSQSRLPRSTSAGEREDLRSAQAVHAIARILLVPFPMGPLCGEQSAHYRDPVAAAISETLCEQDALQSK